MIIDRLKECRKSKKLTQKNIADSLGVSERAYQHYELSTREPNHDTLVKLCTTLNVSSDYLLGLSDDPTRH